ncbi:MAG: zinc carboxypeptidase [Saprospiraceae bacterium]|nr:zinc carboxypeptidase [Saprospiraceae bacterium]
MKGSLSYLFLFTILFSYGQENGLTYYLPAIQYDSKITTPRDFLGFEVGTQHVSHDQLYQYMKLISGQSNRIKLIEYAKSVEHRPLIAMVFTSKNNQDKLEVLKSVHYNWATGQGTGTDPEKVPLVFYQGYSIHGNEASGSNASLLTAYYLAAAQGSDIDKLLDQTIILLDPSFNPDGLQRFSTWVNSNKSQIAVTDPRTREFNETWPGGRTNHYWFDLNRDWMPQQLPESKGRVKLFQEWKPNVLTDHHEQGSNSSFFFMPGEPNRVNPNTPKINQELTKEIAKFHAAELNKIGSLYYTREGYDDYYYGKGSTYPDAQGCVGILFEQASSRGHEQETDNGLLTFPFAIRNHVTTSLSSYKAVVELRSKLLNYQRDFYKNSAHDAATDPVKGYVLQSPGDISKMNKFIDILLANRIKSYQLNANLGGFNKEASIVVPCNQSQYRLIKGMMEKRTKFEDSLFYDISAWTYPLAFNLEYQELSESDNINKLTGKEVTGEIKANLNAFTKSEYAYILDGKGYFLHKGLHTILSNGLRARLIHNEMELPAPTNSQKFARGSILIPVQNQSKNSEEIFHLLKTVSDECQLNIFNVNTGFAESGVDLGTPGSSPLRLPKACILVGQGVDMNDAGEVWHLLDTRMNMPLALVDMLQLSNFNFDDYTTLILVDGVYTALTSAQIAKIKSFVSEGGTILASGRAINWLNANGMAEVIIKPTPSSGETITSMRSYANASADAGTDALAGAIFEARFDKTHPLTYGLWGHTIPLFKSTRVFLDNPKNAYAAPFRYTENPLLSGYVSKSNLDQIKNSAATVINALGNGKIISVPDNLNFRAFWYGTNKVFLNALFYGPILNANTLQRITPKE